jgi:hypothetical protein
MLPGQILDMTNDSVNLGKCCLAALQDCLVKDRLQYFQQNVLQIPKDKNRKYITKSIQ